MSTYTPELTQNCARCARPVAPGMLECPQCKTLVHGDEVEQLAAHARLLEAHGEFAQAANRWTACLPLLPPQSQQAVWIRDHLRELQAGQKLSESRPVVIRGKIKVGQATGASGAAGAAFSQT